MKTHLNNQEILLLTKSGFARNHLCEKNDEDESSATAPDEILKPATWDSMLADMLSVIPFKCESIEPVYVSHVDSWNEFFFIIMGSSPLCIEQNNSINPHSFMEVSFTN